MYKQNLQKINNMKNIIIKERLLNKGFKCNQTT